MKSLLSVAHSPNSLVHRQEGVVLVDLRECERMEGGAVAMIELVHELHPVQTQGVEERRQRFHAHQH